MPEPTSPPRAVESTAAGAAAVRGGALQSAAYITTFLLSLISAPLLIRHLGFISFGRYTTVMALVTIVGGLTDAGMINISLREWSMREGEDRRRTMRLLLGLRLELGCIGITIGVGYALVAGFTQSMVLGTAFAGCGVLLQLVADVLAIALQGELRFGWPALITVARQAVAVALIVVLVLTGAGLLPFLAVLIPAGLVTLALTARVVRGRMPLIPALAGPEAWQLLRDTLPYAAAIAINTIYFRVSILVMHQIGTPIETGYFATSFRVIEVLIGVPALAIGAAFPILTHSASADPRRFAQASGRIVELAFLVAVPAVLALELGAPFVIDVLAPRGGGPIVPVLRIQAVALIATFMATASGYPLLSVRRYTALLIGNCSALAANVVLSLVLIPYDGARGAAIAAVGAESCLAIGQLGFLVRTQRIPIALTTLAVAAVAGIAGASAFLIPGLFSPVRALIGILGYVLVLAALGRLPPEITHFRRIRGER